MTALILSLLLSASSACSGDVLLDAIATVESNNVSEVVGDDGQAVGAYQLHRIYVDDVNRIAKAEYRHADRNDAVKSREMVTIYLAHWGARYAAFMNKPATAEVLARIHNGGPYGWNKIHTKKYWNKVKLELEKQQ